LKFNRILLRVSRISAWVLLAFMIIYIVTGYAWVNRSLMQVSLARQLHMTIDVYMMPVFLAHILISTKFMLKRYGIHYDRLVNTVLLSVGLMSYLVVLSIR
jgi:hypothetical protein